MSRHLLYFCIFSLSSVGSILGATNSLTIKEKAGVSTVNYPIQIGRPFVSGEIANYPQALVDGTAVPTQADVKQRWADGSVKHAVIAFVIPKLNAGATVSVTFANQSSGNNSPLNASQMLAAPLDFNAQMQLTNGTTVTADARKMLSNGAYQTWTSGSIAQTIILADHSTNRTYDIGFDANRSFRPIFHATFWPGVNKVRVRFIGEIASTEAFQDQSYSLTLKTGNAAPAQVYSKASFTHSAATRWTKEFWIGGAPPAIAIDHNLSYVRETRFVPYYDTSRTVSGAAINAACNAWNSAAKDITDAGNWVKYQPQAGSRSDIGPYPDWVVQWLYTGDKCLQDRAFGNADLSASWPVHFREGKAGKIFLRTDAANAGTGVGRVLSLSGRPTMSVGSWNYGTTAADQVTPVGTTTGQNWSWDTAHEPEIGSPIYALTGDFWYLEEMWFWASADAMSNFVSVYHRGPTGAEGVLHHGQIRAMAWILRNRVNTAFITPDNTPEKAYFETLINDAIALEEGARNITTTQFNGNPVWNWGRTQFAPTDAGTAFGTGSVIPGLHQWSVGGPAFAQNEYGICSTYGAGSACGPTVSSAISLFELDYLLFSLGRAKELGYPAGALVSWVSSLYTGMLTDPGFNPFIIDNGRLPTLRTDGKYFSTFADLKNGYNSTWQAATSLRTAADPDGYAAYASAAVSYLTGEQNGQAAWDFMNRNFYSPLGSMNDAPKWAIIPRGSSGGATAPPPPTSVSACDVNKDGVVNAQDVQLSINQGLGISACTADLDGNGKCDVIDVQRIVNASLGAACKVGP